jgi:hypothetical protein
VQWYTQAVKVFKEIRNDAPDHERGNPDAAGPSGDSLQISLFEQQSTAHGGLVRSLVALGRTTAALLAAEDGRSVALNKLLDVDESKEQWSATELLALAADPEVNADLVYYHHDISTAKLWAWVVPRFGGLEDIHFVEQTNIAEDDAPEVVAAINEATREHEGPGAASAAAAAVNLNWLYALLIDPIADKLSTNGRVVFFPHRKFVLTPFSTLRCAMNTSGSSSGSGGVTHLLDWQTVHVGVSLRSLEASVRQRRASRKRVSASSALVVGFPEASIDVDGYSFGSLPGALAEARMVSQVLGCDPLLGSTATTRPKKAVVLQRLASAPVIHIATHGLSTADDGRACCWTENPGCLRLNMANG